MGVLPFLRQPGHQPEIQGENKVNLPHSVCPLRLPVSPQSIPSAGPPDLTAAHCLPPSPIPSHIPAISRKSKELEACSKTHTGLSTCLLGQDTHRPYKSPNRHGLRWECMCVGVSAAHGRPTVASGHQRSSRPLRTHRTHPEHGLRAASWGAGHTPYRTTSTLLASVCDRQHV